MARYKGRPAAAHPGQGALGDGGRADLAARSLTRRIPCPDVWPAATRTRVRRRRTIRQTAGSCQGSHGRAADQAQREDVEMLLEASKNGVAVSIDIGLAFCCAAIFQNKVEVIPNESHQDTTPHWVAFDGWDDIGRLREGTR